MNIADIIPNEDHTLYVKSEDGRSGLLDITPFLESEAFEPLKSRKEFERIYNGRYFIEWACGADLSADTIEARWRPLANDAQQGAPIDAEAAAQPRRD